LFDVGAAGKCRAKSNSCDGEFVVFEHKADWMNKN
jgi:hypothetical protein